MIKIYTTAIQNSTKISAVKQPLPTYQLKTNNMKRSIFTRLLMPVFFLMAFTFTFPKSSIGQLFSEPFNYTAHATNGLPTQSSGAWSSLNSGDSIIVESGNLSYGGFAASTGNRITYGGAGAEAYRTYTSQTTGTVYCSFLLNITSLGSLNATGGYTIGLLDGTTSTFASTVWLRSSGSNYNIGINPRTTAANTVWLSNTLTTGTTYLVVIATQIVSGLTNDISKIWLNPTSLGGSEPAVSGSATNTLTDLTSYQRVFLRQDGTTATPGVLQLDEMRVGTTWASVTPSGATPTITATGTLNALSTTYGTATAIPDSFTVSGADMLAGILITPPTGFEVSQTPGGASGYAGNGTAITVGAAGTIASTKVYVRVAATATVPLSPYSGNIQCTSSGATQVNVATVSSTVTAKGLTISNLSVVSKVYNGNTTATLSGTATLNGVVNSDNTTLSGSPTATFADANVANGIAVSVTGYTLSGSTSGNYTLTQPSLTGNITQASQTITFSSLANKYDTSSNFLLTASSTSGLPISYSSSVSGVATIVGTNGDSVHIVGAGTTVITASQAGNSNYAAATNVNQNQVVISTTLSNQTIDFAPLANKTYGDANFQLTATASSSLPVSYISTNTAVATIVGGDSIHIVGPGTTTITASQSGNGSYNPAPDSSVSFTVDVKPLSVNTASVANKPYDGTDTAYITGITFNESLVGADVVTGSGGGHFADAEPGSSKSVTAFITLAGADAAKYSLPTQPTGLVADITLGNQTITFPPTFSATYGDADIDFSGLATSSAGPAYPVSYSIDNPTVGYFIGNILTITAAGTANIIASQIGDGFYYNPAIDDTAVLTVSKASQTITFNTISTQFINSGSLVLTATASSGLPVAYSSANTSVATISGDVATFVGVGTTDITATQTGDDNYLAATPVVRALNIEYPSIFSNAITDVNPSASNPYTNGQAFDAGLTVNGITRGSGLTAASASNRFSASNWNTTTSLGTTKYMELTLIPNAGKKIDFDKLIYTRQASSTGPATYSLRSSVDNYSSDIFVKTGTNNVTGADTVSLSAAAYQGIKDTIRFRIYGYNASAGGTGSINDFNFKGLVSCYTPTAYTLSGTGVYCGTTPLTLTLNGSQIGVDYQLQKDAVDEGASIAGIGAAINITGIIAAGTYTIIASNNQGGCSTTLTMNGSAVITAGSPNSSTVDTTICSSSLPFSYNGVTTYLGDTSYTVNLTNASGCDSAVTVNLTVNAATSSTTNVTICSNELPYSWNSQSFASAGLHTVHFTNAAGCDSSANLNLTVNTTSSSTTNIAICTTQLPYNWNGNNYSSAGTYTDTLTNAVGCDSVATLILTTSNGVVWANLQYPASGNICQDDSLTIYGQVYETGVTEAAGQGAGITVDFGYNATNTNPLSWTNWSPATFNVQVGNNDEYSGKLKNLASGNYYYTFRYKIDGNTCYQYGGYSGSGGGFWNGTTYVSGELTVKATSTSTTNAAVCQNLLPYVWNGNDYTTTGSYTVHLTNAVGCDSAATLNLTVNASSSSTTNITICSNELPYTWNGVTTYLGDTSFVAHISNEGGCDSAATLNLTVNLTSSSTTDSTICSTSLPFTWNGITTYLGDTTYTVHFTNAVSCDSAATLNLTVKLATQFVKYDTVCSNTLPYIWNDSSYTTSSFGFDTVHLVNAAGCDSTDILRLVVKTAKTTSTAIAICSNQLPYTWNGITTYLGDTTYAVVLAGSNGCDSTATLVLTVNPLPVISATSTSVCMDSTIQLTTIGDGYASYDWTGPNGYTSGQIQLLGPITQNFNTLSGTSWTNDNTIPNWFILQGQGNATSPATATSVLVAGTGSSTNSGAYNFATSGAPTDHSLGSVAANSFASAGSFAFFYGVKIKNTSGFPVNSATITYTGKQYRNSAVAITNSLLVDYSNNATSLTNASGSWTNIPALTFVSPITGGTAGALDANLTANKQTLTTTVTGILLPPGDSMWVRWSDLNDAGNDHGLAIDDVSITLFGGVQNPTRTPAAVNMSGTYTVTVSTKAGCTAQAQTTLTVSAPSSSTLDSAVCTNNFPFTWNGHLFTGAESGVLVHLSNVAGCDSAVTMNVTSVVCNSYLNVKAFVQGYYDSVSHAMISVWNNQHGSGSMNDVDSVTIELHNTSNFAIEQSITGMLHTDGTINLTLPPTAGHYYIAIKAKGVLETWSTDSIAFISGDTTNFDFTTNANKALGDNMIQVESGIWGIYSGDIAVDGNIDIFDYIEWETNSNDLLSGYFPTDLNGDGNIDISDYAIWEANANNLISAIYYQ